ncbi:MAG: hypothetical protein ACOZB3_09380 [Calditrichota bacterium]
MIKMNSQGQESVRSRETTNESVQDKDYQPIDLSFLGSLVPGIVHNLATPMSGVLGATQLIENRNATLADIINSLEILEESQRDELRTQFDRSRASVDILARNARHLADILQVLVQRLNRGASPSREFYSINDLVQNEVRFLEANLTFKHKVKKQLVLATDLPAARCVYSQVAGAIDEYVTAVMTLHNYETGVMEMDFVTESHSDTPGVTITTRFAPLADSDQADVTTGAYFRSLEEAGWTIRSSMEQGVSQVCLICPRS